MSGARTMQVLLFDLHGGVYALKLEAVERILGPGEEFPAGRRRIDLAVALELGPELPAVPAAPATDAHVALLAGGGAAIAMGRPLGAVLLDPAWILPLPGFMFRSDSPPFRGLIDLPAEARSRPQLAALGGGGLLLDEQRLVEAAA